MKLGQVSFSNGEISPDLHSRVDIQKFLSSLKTCRNFFVRPQGGASNRAGTRFVYALDASSTATLLPFVRSEDDAYIAVFQANKINIFSNGAYVADGGIKTIVSITYSFGQLVIITSAAHGFNPGDTVTISGLVATGIYAVNGAHSVASTPSVTTFKINVSGSVSGSVTTYGTVSKALTLTTFLDSSDIQTIRYTQSADVMTICSRGFAPYELTRVSANVFQFFPISDITTGPFLDYNATATTLKSAAATGTGITVTASSSIFNANHVGALLKLSIEDISAIPPWEPAKVVALNDQRLSNGKIYKALNAGTTGTVPPSHDELSQYDGAGAVKWEYLHSLYGIAKITAQAGTTATVDILSYIPVISPSTTTKWAFGAWSEDQGYPGIVTYYQDRLVFASTLNSPQSQWASKSGDYHNFSESNPIADDDSITQTLNSRQTNKIVDIVPLDQLISLTANASYASPKRGETWVPATVGFYPQANTGAADLPAVLAGGKAVYAERFGTRLRELAYAYDTDKFGGNELTVLARHLFKDFGIVDMAYAEYPDGILWCVRADGVLIGLTYLPDQNVVAFSTHDTSGYFERVCVIPEDGRDALYCVVRRTLPTGDVRYLERMEARVETLPDAYYVDCGLSYDGRNTTATTITASGASYNGGDSVTLTASASIFTAASVGDAIQFGAVDCLITAYTSGVIVTAELQSPLSAALHGVATTEWTFAKDTFSNLSHLEGMLVTGLADGNAIDPDDTTTAGIVTNGEIVLAYPAGVVHIGLSYSQEIQTLTMNIAGDSKIIDNAKIVPKVSISVLNTVGLKVGKDESNLEEIATRDFEYYTDANSLRTGVQVGYLLNTWNKDSSVLIRQDYPKPATILAVIPTVVVGNNG